MTTTDEKELFLKCEERKARITELVTPQVFSGLISNVKETSNKRLTKKKRVVIIMFTNTAELIDMLETNKEVGITLYYDTVEGFNKQSPDSKMVKDMMEMTADERAQRVLYVIMTAPCPMDTGTAFWPEGTPYPGLVHNIIRMKVS